MIGDNRTYEEIIQDDLFTPMGMNYTSFFPTEELKEYIVVTNTMPGDAGVVDINLGFLNPYPPLPVLTPFLPSPLHPRRFPFCIYR